MRSSLEVVTVGYFGFFGAVAQVVTLWETHSYDSQMRENPLVLCFAHFVLLLKYFRVVF